MRTLLSTLFVWCILCTFSFKAEAEHLVGSEISYACTSTPGIFEVTFVMYANCGPGGIPFCPGTCGNACATTLTISGADPGFTTTTFGNITLTLQQVRDVDVKITCPNIKSICNNRGCVTPGTYSPGYERYEYKGFANLGPTSGIPAACCNIRLWFSNCCRTININTGSAAEDLYSEAIINRCFSVSPCNSSPVFHNDPKMFLSGGENYVGNWGAIDPDHDSLSYNFAPALKAYGTSVTYTPPFAYNRPMPWTGAATALFPLGISCDPLNGDIMFTPPNNAGLFTGIMCIEVKQWKKIGGVPTLIGTTRRDVETSVGGALPNNPPRFITSPPEDNNVSVPRTNWSICAGEQLCFTVTAKDTDYNPSTVSDTTFMRWDSALANLGATFAPDYDASKRQLPDSLGGGPREDRYKFCWTPADSLAGSNPYYFTVRAADKRCPNPGELIRAFSILVLPKAAAQIVQAQSYCQKTLLNYVNLTPSVNIASANWRIAKMPDDSSFSNGFDTYTASTTPTPFLFKNAGRFYIQLIVGNISPIGTPGCTRTYTSYVDAPGLLLKDSIQATDLTCAVIPSGKIVLKGNNGTPPYQYKLNNQAYTTNAVFTNLMAGPYITWVKDLNGCETPDTVLLNQPAPIVTTINSNSPVCHNGANGRFTIHAIGGIPPYTFQLNQQGFHADSVLNGLASGPYQIMVKDANSCFKTDSFVLSNPASLNVDYIIRKPLCVNDSNGSIIIFNTTGKYPFTHALNNGGFQSSNTFSNLPAGAFLITSIDSNNCVVSDSVTIQKPNALTANYSVKQTNCFESNDGEILISPQTGKAPFKYRLNNEPFQSAPIFVGLKADHYALTLKDSNNCMHTDSVTVTQPTLLTYVKNKTAISCFNANDGSLSIIPGGGTAPYQLLFDSVLYPLPTTISSVKPGNYRYHIIDNKNCLIELMDSFNNPQQIVAGTISGDTTVVLNSTHTYSVPFQSTISFAWGVTGGTLLSSSMNPPLATIRWDAAGTGMIWVMANNSSSCGDTSILHVNIGSVGLNELSQSWGLNVYPNPAKNMLNIQLQKLPEHSQIQLYDVQGKLVLQQELRLTQQLNIETLTPGIYMLKIGAWSGHIVKE